MIAFETEVRIGRPIDDVFAFVTEPTQFPRWNSAVQSVHVGADALFLSLPIRL